MSSENYDEVDLENLPQRERTKTMKIEDPVSGILSSSKNMIINRSSIGAQNQGKEGTCYAYVGATLITRYITQKFPDKFKISEHEANALYHGKRTGTCFLINTSSVEFVKHVLTYYKCRNNKRYNYMLLFYYILFIIKNKFGCDGGNTITVLNEFFNSNTLFDLNALSPKLDIMAFNKFIKPFMDFRKFNELQYRVVEEYYDLNQNNPQRNWILNFPEGAKRALENNMYVAFSFCLSKNQWETINTENIYDSNPIIKDTSCILPISCHGMVITKWEQEAPGMPAYITILNSWGTEWGIDGFIRISSENYYKFVMNPFCKKEFNSNGILNKIPETETYFSMSFTYIEVADDKPYVTQNPNFLSRVMSKLPFSRGGKSKKRKSKKRKSKKRKTRKRY
jgi:hypothetical protein